MLCVNVLKEDIAIKRQEISASQKSYLNICATQTKVKTLLNGLINTFKRCELYCTKLEQIFCSQKAEKEASWQNLLQAVFENTVFLRNTLCQILVAFLR